MKKFFLLWVFLLVSASSVSSVYAVVPDCSFEPLVVASIGETREQKGTVRLKKFCNRYWTGLVNWSAQNLRIIKAPKEADIITRVYEIGFKFGADIDSRKRLFMSDVYSCI